jgi:hypothetical protein
LATVSSATLTTDSTTSPESPDKVTSSAPTTASGLPSAARMNSPEGATAFLNFFIEQANKAYRTLDVAEIQTMYNANCKACASIPDSVNEWKSKGYTYDGNFATPSLVTISAFPGDGTAKVFVRSQNATGKVKNSQGSVVETVPPEDSQSSVFLRYNYGSWLVEEIKVAA